MIETKEQQNEMSNERPIVPNSDPATVSTNGHGNTVKSWEWHAARPFCGDERYYWDFGPCGPRSGWTQYDTDQDAWYFGIWVHMEKRLILTYAEGDLSLVECASSENLKLELAGMAECYGPPPPSMVAIDTDTGQVTEVYSERPS